MAPWSATFLRAAFDYGIIVKLVVPDCVVEGAVIHLVESCPYWVRCCVACATISLLKRGSFTACIDKLLAEPFVILRLTPK